MSIECSKDHSCVHALNLPGLFSKFFDSESGGINSSKFYVSLSAFSVIIGNQNLLFSPQKAYNIRLVVAKNC